jgi:hypothetical protein
LRAFQAKKDKRGALSLRIVLGRSWLVKALPRIGARPE